MPLKKRETLLFTGIGESAAPVSAPTSSAASSSMPEQEGSRDKRYRMVIEDINDEPDTKKAKRQRGDTPKLIG